MKDLFKEMFLEMVVKKNASLIPKYYHPEFVLYANREVISYEDYRKSHNDYYATLREYSIRYDEEAWVEQDSKLAGRVFITIKQPNKFDITFEVVLIVHYKSNKIYRLWETTSPDWTQMEEFK